MIIREPARPIAANHSDKARLMRGLMTADIYLLGIDRLRQHQQPWLWTHFRLLAP